MPDTSKKSKLTRGKGTGNVIFGSEVEEQQQAQAQENMPGMGSLLTNQERFERIEAAIVRIASQMPAGDGSLVIRELKGE